MNDHPNLWPVECSNIDDMRLLALQMRNLCLSKLPDKHECVASASIKEAIRRAENAKQNIVESGHLRFIRYTDGRVVNVCLTLLEEDGEFEWHLSMSHATLVGPRRVADDLCLMICEAFLGDSYQEVESKAIWKTVRHFTKYQD